MEFGPDGGSGIRGEHQPRERAPAFKKNGIKPWRVKEWVIPWCDAAFVCSMEEVLEVYSRKYDAENPVVCFGESPKQLIGEVRRPHMSKDGTKYKDYEYLRNGTVDLMMIVEPLGCRREVLVRESHDVMTWARVMEMIVEEMYPEARKVTLVMDNLSSHMIYNLYKGLPPGKGQENKGSEI